MMFNVCVCVCVCRSAPERSLKIYTQEDIDEIEAKKKEEEAAQRAKAAENAGQSEDTAPSRIPSDTATSDYRWSRVHKS